ncbi:MAG: hypothetical protein J4G03_01875 [Gemmatimonadetes bacterium]|nr:hypothetical protein [Gemmatimonadota bacterium]
MRLAVLAQHHEFVVAPIREHGAAVREQTAEPDSLERVVTGVGAVAVQWLGSEAEGSVGSRGARVFDEAHTGAVFDVDRDVRGGLRAALASGEERHRP